MSDEPKHFSLVTLEAMLADPAVAIIIAEVRGHMVGFAQLTNGSVHALASPGAAVELCRLYVQRPFTGKGIGKALLNRSEAWAAAQGAASLWLTAWVGNRHAIDFYTRQGYRDAGPTVYVLQGESYENRVFTQTPGTG